MAATRNEKILLLAKVIEFSNREDTYNYIVHVNFNCDLPNINFKIYLLQGFLRLMVDTWKLCSRCVKLPATKCVKWGNYATKRPQRKNTQTIPFETSGSP